jgi:hypothetical protein
MFLAGVIAAAVIVTAVISKDTINSRRNWIDQCVVEQWESTGERHIGVRDYCLAKYRQTR